MLLRGISKLKAISPSAWAIALCALGMALRLFRLTAASLSGDEGWAWSLNIKPLEGWLHVIAVDDHPPLFYFIHRPWSLVAGYSELALRIISVFAGVLAIAALYRLVRQLFGPRAALMAAALLMLSPQHVDFSQEARMYTILAALGLGAALCLWEALRLQGRAAWKAWAGYLLLMSAAVHCHYYGWLLWAAGVAYVLLVTRGRRLVMTLALQGLVGVSFLPWAIYAGVLGKAKPPLSSQGVYLTSWAAIAGLLDRAFNFIGTAQRADWTTLSSGFTWLLGASAILLLWRYSNLRRSGLLTLTHLAVPIALALGLSLINVGIWFRFFGAKDMAAYRFLLPLLPWFCALVAAGLAVVRPRALAYGGLALALALESFSTTAYLLAPRHNKSDYREMVSYVRAHLQPGDGIFLLGDTQVFTFPYYAPDLHYAMFSPGRELNAEQIQETRVEISRQAAPYARLWVLAGGGVSAYDPGDVLGNLLGQIGFITFRQWYQSGELRLYTLDRQGQPLHLTKDALVDNSIRCQGFDINTLTAHPGDTLTLTLYWQPTADIKQNLVVFTHVLRINGTLAAQHDGEPVGGSRRTTSWQVGEIIADRHAITLPPDFPPGTYTLQAGFTPFGIPASRLSVTGPDAQPARDAVRLGTLKVEP